MDEGPADGVGPGRSRVGSVINGKWQVDACIGTGGMATVYAATHRNGARAALKMLHPQLSHEPRVRARFLREGYVANAVGHPGVVAVLDDDVTEDGAVFLVLELLEGETMDARRLRLGGALPVDEALDFADETLEVLGVAHDKGIVHRDVKPENVFLTRSGSVKLLDFGLARMKSARIEATQTGVTIGTPEFIPPEQASGRRDVVDARSDLWGVGATLFTALSGRYVHDDAQSLHAQLLASATRRPRPIRQVARHLSPEIARVIDRALEFEMADRFQRAADMRTALRAARNVSRPKNLDSMTLTVVFERPSTPSSFDADTRPLPQVSVGLAPDPRETSGNAASARPRPQLSTDLVGRVPHGSVPAPPPIAIASAPPALQLNPRREMRPLSSLEASYAQAASSAALAPSPAVNSSAEVAPFPTAVSSGVVVSSAPSSIPAKHGDGATTPVSSSPIPLGTPRASGVELRDAVGNAPADVRHKMRVGLVFVLTVIALLLCLAAVYICWRVT